MNDRLFDCAAWKLMLDREEIPVTQASIGILTRDGFAARSGSLLAWCGTPDGAAVTLREYRGTFGADLAMLLVADEETLRGVLDTGLGRIRQFVRSGRLHPYMLMTLDDLEEAGLADFVEDLGLVFPKH